MAVKLSQATDGTLSTHDLGLGSILERAAAGDVIAIYAGGSPITVSCELATIV